LSFRDGYVRFAVEVGLDTWLGGRDPKPCLSLHLSRAANCSSMFHDEMSGG
jgi:hypothetical protein